MENRLRRLGRDARRLFERADEGSGIIYIPTLALVEISEAAWRGRIRLSGGFTRWMQALLSSPNYVIADLTPDIVLRAEELYAIPERGDRLIAATALELDLPLHYPRPRDSTGCRRSDHLVASGLNPNLRDPR